MPADGARWATWKRYCDATGISMGRAVTVLIDRELLSVFGEHTAGEWPALAQQAVEELENREARIESREHRVDTDEAQMRERSERLRRREDEIEARKQLFEAASKRFSSASTARTKIGRNERCPCESGLKYKRCHGLAARQTYEIHYVRSRTLLFGPHLVRGRTRSDHKRREPVRGENLRGTGESAETPTLAVPPDSDYGSEDWGFESLRACQRNRVRDLPYERPVIITIHECQPHPISFSGLHEPTRVVAG